MTLVIGGNVMSAEHRVKSIEHELFKLETDHAEACKPRWTRYALCHDGVRGSLRGAAEDRVNHSRRAPPGVPVERPASLGTQSGAVPAWVFVLVVALPVAVGWFVALSLDLSWVRAPAGARVATARGPVASDRGTNVPDAPTAAAPEADSRPAPGPGQAARVAHTDGQGVVLRTAPREDARVPRGLLEGPG